MKHLFRLFFFNLGMKSTGTIHLIYIEKIINMNKYFTLGLTLLLVMAAAFSMGCTETGPEGS